MLACSNHAITIIKLKYDLMVFSVKRKEYRSKDAMAVWWRLELILIGITIR